MISPPHDFSPNGLGALDEYGNLTCWCGLTRGAHRDNVRFNEKGQTNAQS